MNAAPRARNVLATAAAMCAAVQRAAGQGAPPPSTCLDASVQWSAVTGMPEPEPGRYVTIERLNWESSSLVAEAAGILLSETLGVHVNYTENTFSAGAFERIGAGPADAGLEIWPEGRAGDAARDVWLCDSGGATRAVGSGHCLLEVSQGYGGFETVYVGRPVGIARASTEQALLDHCECSRWVLPRLSPPSDPRPAPADRGIIC